MVLKVLWTVGHVVTPLPLTWGRLACASLGVTPWHHQTESYPNTLLWALASLTLPCTLTIGAPQSPSALTHSPVVSSPFSTECSQKYQLLSPRRCAHQFVWFNSVSASCSIPLHWDILTVKTSVNLLSKIQAIVSKKAGSKRLHVKEKHNSVVAVLVPGN